ncbi:hypothetical protein D4764_01G0014990 [Takifugu flavidus]|uniref:Uncharacterized protein n=1 Tax=Takifugu flavidus TaxID=433684 RepID=A0A5C6PPU7_9TELE|nr:hypothetical protein D4764_01G0014990 [Takifugu flavidus]
MSARRIYSDGACTRGATRTLIFSVLRYSSRLAILRAAKKDPLSINGRKIRFSPDYSNFTVRRRQSFQRAMDTARAKGLDFFLLYPATLKIKDGAQFKAFTSPKEAEGRLFGRRCDPRTQWLRGGFSRDVNTVLISLLLKKDKDPTDCSSYRPLSLLNSDLKIFAKLLARRLERYMPLLVNPDQRERRRGRRGTGKNRRGEERRGEG